MECGGEVMNKANDLHIKALEVAYEKVCEVNDLLREQIAMLKAERDEAIVRKEKWLQETRDYIVKVDALTAENEQWRLSRDGVMAEIEAYEDRNMKLTAERDILQLYYDATHARESERERQIAIRSAERDELQAMLVAGEPPYYTKWKEVTAENGKLREAILKAIDGEPEYPGNMPDEMWTVINGDRDAIAQAMRLTVQLTKQGIRERFLSGDSDTNLQTSLAEGKEE